MISRNKLTPPDYYFEKDFPNLIFYGSGKFEVSVRVLSGNKALFVGRNWIEFGSNRLQSSAKVNIRK